MYMGMYCIVYRYDLLEIEGFLSGYSEAELTVYLSVVQPGGFIEDFSTLNLDNLHLIVMESLLR